MQLAAIEKRKPARQQVYDSLRAAIVYGDLTPGSALSEKELSLRLGVSRTPVREALIQLSEDNLVEIHPQVGSFVTKMRVSEILDSQFLREAIECAAIRRAAARATAADIGKLQVIVEGQQRAGRKKKYDRQYYRYDSEFHRYLIELSGLGVWRYVGLARDHESRIRHLAVPELGVSNRAVQDHMEIIESIASGDPDKAEDAMRKHLVGNIEHTTALVRRFPNYFTDIGLLLPDMPGTDDHSVR